GCLLRTGRDGVVRGAAERVLQRLLPVGRVGGLGTGQTRWRPFYGDPGSDRDRSLRRRREHPVAHVPDYVNAASRHRPDPDLYRLVHLALYAKRRRDAAPVRRCIGRGVPVGDLSCLSICWRPPRSPRLHARVGGHAGVGGVPREGTEGRPLHPARGRGRLPGGPLLPHHRQRGLSRPADRHPFPLAHLDRTRHVPGDAPLDTGHQNGGPCKGEV
ncbi:MAG: Arginine/ornithine antiporter ArcD, partial [uncultured Rubrobacteraceae bacterium]